MTSTKKLKVNFSNSSLALHFWGKEAVCRSGKSSDSRTNKAGFEFSSIIYQMHALGQVLPFLLSPRVSSSVKWDCNASFQSCLQRYNQYDWHVIRPYWFGAAIVIKTSRTSLVLHFYINFVYLASSYSDCFQENQIMAGHGKMAILKMKRTYTASQQSLIWTGGGSKADVGTVVAGILVYIQKNSNMKWPACSPSRY